MKTAELRGLLPSFHIKGCGMERHGGLPYIPSQTLELLLLPFLLSSFPSNWVFGSHTTFFAVLYLLPKLFYLKGEET